MDYLSSSKRDKEYAKLQFTTSNKRPQLVISDECFMDIARIPQFPTLSPPSVNLVPNIDFVGSASDFTHEEDLKDKLFNEGLN